MCMHIYMQVASSIKWNTNGSVLAVSGNQTSSGATSRDVSMVQFYSAHGQHLRTLKVRGAPLLLHPPQPQLHP